MNPTSDEGAGGHVHPEMANRGWLGDLQLCFSSRQKLNINAATVQSSALAPSDIR